MERWEEGFYITAMAGGQQGASLVVMSKGTPYTQQSYKVRWPDIQISSMCSISASISFAFVSTNACYCKPQYTGNSGLAMACQIASFVSKDCWISTYLYRAMSTVRERLSGSVILTRLHPGVGLIPLQVDQQEVEGGLLRDIHGDLSHALGRGYVPQRRLCGPVRGARLPVPLRGHPPQMGWRCIYPSGMYSLCADFVPLQTWVFLTSQWTF